MPWLVIKSNIHILYNSIKFYLSRFPESQCYGASTIHSCWTGSTKWSYLSYLHPLLLLSTLSSLSGSIPPLCCREPYFLHPIMSSFLPRCYWSPYSYYYLVACFYRLPLFWIYSSFWFLILFCFSLSRDVFYFVQLKFGRPFLCSRCHELWPCIAWQIPIGSWS